MQNEWILDVLSDLKGFADQNGMSALADKLADTRLVATLDLLRQGKGTSADDRSPAFAAGQNGQDVPCVGRRV
ncbi:hypothetical protein [Roseovarius pacificus]|uniref:hypothetical protein n=1 Tax=Roseovarius pacificus TaxID=337701 RepID=UPI004039FF87